MIQLPQPRVSRCHISLTRQRKLGSSIARIKASSSVRIVTREVPIGMLPTPEGQHFA